MSKQSCARSLSQALAAALVEDVRNDGTKFTKLADESPAWMSEAVRAAHDDLMPNDWIYETCRRVADRMTEADPAAWQDSVSDWADSMVSVYNTDRGRGWACI